MLIRAEEARAQVAVDPAAGRRTAQRVADAARAAEEFEPLVVALCAAGWAAREIYDHADALRCLDEAVRVARRKSLNDGLTEALVARAGVHMEFGRTSRARRDITAARAAATATTRAEVEFAEALLHSFGGDQEAAAHAYRRALHHAPSEQRRVRLRASHNLGLVEVRRGRHDEARRLLNLAAGLADAMDAPAVKAVVANSQAVAASEQGDPVAALRRFDEAEALMISAGVPRGEMLADKASALLALRLLDEAAASVARAVDEFAADDGRALMFAEALLLQSRIELAREQFDAAASAAAKADELLRRQRRYGWQAHAKLVRLTAAVAIGTDLDEAVERQLDRVERTMRSIGHLPGAVEAALLGGQIALRRNRPDRARRKLQRVVDSARGGPILVRLRGWTAAALVAEAAGDHRRLAQVGAHGLRELGRYRATFASAELRARAAAHGLALAEPALRSAVRSGRPESVWYWMERSRSMVFVRSEPDACPAIQPQLSELRQLERTLAEMPSTDPIATSDVLRSIRRVEHDIRRQTWVQNLADDRWTPPTVRRMRELRAALGTRRLLQYGVVDGRIIGVLVAASGVHATDVAAVDAVMHSCQQLAFALRRLSRPRSAAAVQAARVSADQELRRLSELLVEPFGVALDDVHEVVVAPPTQLVGVPWGALAPLAAVPVRIVPSATAWHATRQRTPVSERVVVVAGPDLPGADAEATTVAALHADAECLVGLNAECEAVRTAASGAWIVHLACHGRLRTDSPTFSSLQVADGPLTVHDLERLRAPAHHWVLAACDLGAPGRPAGAELEGVLATLLFGGAAGVVAASVPVPDQETVGFMTDLHRALAQRASLAEAVLRARRGRDTDDPAEFVTSIAFACFGGG